MTEPDRNGPEIQHQAEALARLREAAEDGAFDLTVLADKPRYRPQPAP